MLTYILNSVLSLFGLQFGSGASTIKKKTRTMAEYVREFPEVKTKYGIRCVQCGSGSIYNKGVGGSNDSRRVFICNHCNTRLYRSEW